MFCCTQCSLAIDGCLLSELYRVLNDQFECILFLLLSMVSAGSCDGWTLAFWSRASSMLAGKTFYQNVDHVDRQMSESAKCFCQFTGCSRSYTTYDNLLHHYNPTHKPDNLERKKRQTAKDVASAVLSSQLPTQTRSARLKECIQAFSDPEIIEHALPRVAQLIKP